VDVDPVAAQDPLARGDHHGGANQSGQGGDGAAHDGLGGQDPAAPRAGRQGGADQAPPVLGGDEHHPDDDHHDQPGERAHQGLGDGGAKARRAGHGRRDVAGPGHGEPTAGLVEPATLQRGRVAGATDVLAGPCLAGPGALPGEVVEGGGGLGGAARGASQYERLAGRLRVLGGGGEQPDLHGRCQPGQAGGAEGDPVGAVGRLVAGNGGTAAGQPQPARGGRGDRAGLAGGVVAVVVLHPYAVAAGDHDRGVGRSRPGAGLDDEPGLGPRRQTEARAHGRVPTGRWPGQQAGQRGHPDGDAAVAGQRLVHQVEAVGHRLPIWPDRKGARRDRTLLAARTVLAGEQPETHDHRRGGRHADDPAADRPELGPLGAQQPREPVAPGPHPGAV
jgi:hypothetical protein